MKHTGEIVFFFSRVREGLVGPLVASGDPKSRPKGGQDGQKWPRTGPPEGSGQSFGGLLGDFMAKVTIS